MPIDREIEYGLKKIEYKIPIGNGHFTPTQYKIYKMIRQSNFFSFSGPTSMGKSFIIKQFILEKIQKDNFVKGFCILVPSKALIKQYLLEFIKVLSELNITKFNVLTTPNVLDFTEFEEDNFIFILTPERLLNLLSSTTKVQLDYLIIDEAHKLFNDDDRALTYYTSIDYCMTKFKFIKVIMSSPLIKNPNIYGNMYYRKESTSIRALETPVSQNLFYIDLLKTTIDFYDDNKPYHFNISRILKLHTANGILHKVGQGNSLIYLNSKNEMIEYAIDLCAYFKENNIDILNVEEKAKVNQVCELIAKIIHPEYYLIECIKLGIGYHYGNLPLIIRERVEELFKNGTVKYLFCTSTLLEGVNMPAKNVFIFSDKIGRKNISKIDFWNLAGRAGRLGYEFYGNIFCLKIKENM
ncbi:DEAD/DEAH box helicase, partial [Clostridium botulinum]|uniref:DEAD/DEAH box helicase n=1 Tax=Clostridium botulinum TaxID=1491 RepID=UPI00138F9C80